MKRKTCLTLALALTLSIPNCVSAASGETVYSVSAEAQATEGKAEAGGEAYMDIAPETTNFAHPDTLGATCRGVEGYIPKLAGAKIVRSWTGWCDCTADGVCVLGTVEEAPGLILACGFNGHGFGTAPAVAYMMAQIALGEKPLLDLSALAYERFC